MDERCRTSVCCWACSRRCSANPGRTVSSRAAFSLSSVAAKERGLFRRRNRWCRSAGVVAAGETSGAWRSAVCSAWPAASAWCVASVSFSFAGCCRSRRRSTSTSLAGAVVFAAAAVMRSCSGSSLIRPCGAGDR
ncbi:hypothetical protein FHR32_006846 [Streptosporangium album]|uniref:Uncharacterized protein n=1 Tax=Streptosporangium album TaxID=47479 RepID=A0A7W7S233_9ACTN|nr:hypothetical protein [Streptosporangium album]MBB4942460.1 hypothetical protein [Streptosporangium album]